MDELMILRSFAAVTTVLAAALVAVNVNARVTVAGFAIFIVASIAWMADGWVESKASLVIRTSCCFSSIFSASCAGFREQKRKLRTSALSYSQNPPLRRKALLMATAAFAPSAIATATRRTSRETSPAT
jgi:hypothetical protein